MKFFNNIVKKCKNCWSLKELECVYGSMIKSNATEDCFIMNQFITACSNLWETNFAVFTFTQMENPNVFVYNAIIGASVNCFRPIQALQIYIDMLRAQISPSSYTFPSIVKGCKLLSVLESGEAIHGQIWRHGFGSHVYVQTALIDYYANFGRVGESRRVFDLMPDRDVFAWTSILSAHCQSGDLATARELFDQMPQKNIASWNTMIHGYAKVGNVDSAEFLFNKMVFKDLISWTTMINCYSQNKQYREALEIFGEMKRDGIRPDEVTMATVISACAHLGVPELGKVIHFYVLENMFDLDVYIGSALVDMYAKCGMLDRSLVVFYKLREKNLFCWNSVIEGLALHGRAEEALILFSRMQKENIKPNSVTFVSVLTACTHARLVEEGKRLFQSVTRDFSIPLAIEHYGCMVDLLCKAGLLEEALALIGSMKMEPNSIVWGALLGGCKLHKNLDIAQVAVDNLMVLEPNNSGYYNLLVNMYAEANRWTDVSNLRAQMKELGVEKRCPGSSWIEVEKKIYQFTACDNHHPVWGQIHSLLYELDRQLKLPGQVPLDSFVETCRAEVI